MGWDVRHGFDQGQSNEPITGLFAGWADCDIGPEEKVSSAGYSGPVRLLSSEISVIPRTLAYGKSMRAAGKPSTT